MATRGSIAPRGSVAIAQSKQGVGTPQFASYDERAAASGGQVLYGLDKELAEKAAAKYDVGMEHKCREWIEAVTGDKLGESTLQEELKNGVVLCNLINAIKPGLINKSANPNPSPNPNPNPNSNANPTPTQASSAFGTLLCMCGAVFDPTRAMIACDGCGRWFHAECVDVDLDDFGSDNSFWCAACRDLP